MRKTRLVPAVLITFACSLFLLPESATAQPGNLPLAIRKVDGGREPTPVYSVKGPQTSGKSKDWFRVFAEYDTEPDWIDELTFTFYVRVKGRTRDVPPFTLFKGETTYIHIPKEKSHIADMFIHPHIIARFGDVDAVAVEVRSGGRVIARDGKPRPNEAWWERMAPVTGVLLNRSETPFSFINLDAQQIIKPKQ